MKDLSIGNWYKLPPKERIKKPLHIVVVPSGTGRKKAKRVKSCKKIKK